MTVKPASGPEPEAASDVTPDENAGVTPEPNEGVTPEPDTPPTEDQAEDKRRALLRDLARERKARQQAERQIADLRAALDGGAQDTEHALAQARQEALEARMTAMRLEAAVEAGLPPSMAARLVGATPSELAEDAVALAALVLPKKTNRPDAAAGNGSHGDQQSHDPNDLLRTIITSR